jgi:hypothetical protein
VDAKEHVGAVTKDRFAQIVGEARELIAEQSRIQFQIGDWALEIEPLQPHGGQRPGDPGVDGVGSVLHDFAEEIGVAPATVVYYRWVSSRWPKEKRVTGVSHYVHEIMAAVPERFELLAAPPDTSNSGTRWTPDVAARYAGRTPATPRTVQEKVNRIHDLASDPHVASIVATDLLRRPDVAHTAMADATARHQVNRAQIDRGRQVQARADEATPSIKRAEHHLAYLDLLGSGMALISTIGRNLPLLRRTPLDDEDKDRLHAMISKIRTALDWLESYLEKPTTNIDTAFARLMREESP